jgi:hypothetical protein
MFPRRGPAQTGVDAHPQSGGAMPLSRQGPATPGALHSSAFREWHRGPEPIPPPECVTPAAVSPSPATPDARPVASCPPPRVTPETAARPVPGDAPFTLERASALEHS